MKSISKIAVAVTAAIAVGALAGCTSDSPAEGGEAEGPLTVWIMGDSGANFEELVAPWAEESGTEVEVVAVPWDGIDERLTTAVASGSGPDVLQVGLSKLRTFADAGALMPLDDHLEDHPGLAPENFPDGIAGDASAVGGETVSIPWVSDTRVLFTRTDILAENGIDSPPTTWEDLRADAKTLAGRGDGQYGYYIPQWDSPLPVFMTWSNGGDIIDADGNVDFDTPEFAAAVDTYTGLYADGSVPTNADFDQAQGFISGVAPMLISGPYLAATIAGSAPELEGQWTVSAVPAGSDSATSVFAGSNLAVWHNTDQVEQSLDLVEYLSEPATQLEWFDINGELPANVDALADETLLANPLVQVYSEQLADARILPLVPNWDGGVGTDLLTALNSIVLTGADRDQAIQTLISQTEGISVD
ncbi:N-Acetyl-D-glucosamine ABC transport system, sugar-binding protein [Microbacterium esteraromaticum]|uniref:N-Acetyl-D-glucosamine ABC transport system, sugar-binding protein n=1 Tax=Microbacterium esteraromaticum TaxID=57043 RepID=A0A1R4KHT8_9MICO|nr:extracellular solute-binding protein [Microbacterium esteraromaticum]SJN43828.1 N-Acetyl-D-glucosamine ABC transport system, sugar-binding protein [Microbacterium esteraromaticum]